VLDPISMFMIAILGLLIYFMIRNSRKQRKTQEELASKLMPGANIMTSFGLFGTVVEINDDTNIAIVDAGNGVLLSLHRQTLTKVVDEEENTEEEVPSESSESSTKDES
jgi:preprotein translocase subunit YajC